ncbi:pyridoxal-phosphate dependent enzyme [Halobacillus kuroshimensis]|uniref:pyridoxal-phosphate dependent enzyme n=1 Tax=Halobacillus kuroshimensis TaxID=302481 RepID=UPI0003FC9017|nr:pyridoxal-phosphate dependent enzyme [Halobacillus kuroshimensis]
MVLRDVWLARKRIESIVKPTPLVYSEFFSERSGQPVYLKMEQSHPAGSFKIRGAANKLLSLTEEEKKRGVTTFSTGNHGIATAYAARQMGISCTVCISRRVPEAKLSRLKRLGADIEQTGVSQDEAAVRCRELASKYGMTIIQPFDDPEVIAGQGTIGLELMEQLPELKEVVIPLSGGGLLSGIGFVLKKMDPTVSVTGVTMERSAVMQASLKKGAVVKLEEEYTLADSLLGGIGEDNRYTFSMTMSLMDKGVLLQENRIKEGLYSLLDHHKIIVEGAAAVGAGYLLDQPVSEGPVVLIITGNNVDTNTVKTWMDS